MKRSLLPLLLVAALGLGAYLAVQETVPWWLKDISGPTMPHWLRDLLGRPAAPLTPLPITPPRRPLPAPTPCPGPGPCPRRPSWGAQAEISIGDRIAVQGQAPMAARFVIGGPSLDGVEVACDLPPQQHQRNTGGSDGAGLCVFTSISMLADWHGNRLLRNFRDWMKSKPGGGYPDKVRQMIDQIAREKGEPPPPYLQVTNGDTSILEEAMNNRLMLGITYGGRDGVYYRGPVPHMVDLVAYNRKANRAAILDNNYPGQLLWMSCDDLDERWKDGGGGWAFAMLLPGPPPVPVNQAQANKDQPMFTSCPTCQPPAIVVAAPQSQPAAADVPLWCPHPQDPRTWYLSRNGKQLGTYMRNTDTYHALQADNTFQSDVLPPVPVPEAAWPTQPIRHNNRVFGVEQNKVRQAPAYEVNGRPVQRADLIGAIQAAGLPDVRGKVWCVVAGGTEQQRQQVVDDIERNPDLTAIRNRFVVKQYAAGEWPLDVGLQSKGSPSIQFLAAEDDRGKAADLGHFDANPGAAELGQAMIGALRQVDPNYRPELVRRPNSPYGDETMLLTIAAIVVVAFLLLLPGRRR